MAACSRQRPKGVIFLTIRMRKVSGLRASGRPSEKTSDWYAQVNHGKVWYLGEDAFEFVDGHWVPSRRFLEAGRGGALPGIIREAHPKVGGPLPTGVLRRTRRGHGDRTGYPHFRLGALRHLPSRAKHE